MLERLRRVDVAPRARILLRLLALSYRPGHQLVDLREVRLPFLHLAGTGRDREKSAA